MKALLHKILSFSMALIVLYSSFSFTMNTHYCCGKIANIAFLVSADNCGMDMQVCKNDISKKQTSVDKETCCDDVSEIIQGNDTNQEAQTFQLELPKMEFLTAFIYTYINQFQEETSIVSYSMYEPPSVYKNIQTFFQVFRI